MKKIILILAAVFSLALTGCNFNAFAQTGERVMCSYDLRAFNAVEISGDFIVEVSQGAYSVSLDIPKELESYLKVAVKDGVLSVRYKDIPVKLSRIFSRSDYRTVAKVSLPEVEVLDISGACALTASDLKCSNLSVSLSGACKAELSGKFGQLAMDCSGASECSLSGTAKLFQLECTGASKTLAEDLVCRKAEAKLTGASTTIVCATKELDINCTGAGKVQYRVEDDTIVRVESSGASKITRLK